MYFRAMVTLKQLAEQLNVSISTVSKALSDSDEISKDTINRVKKLAKELNYQPNRVALSLKNNQTKTIGVIIPSILNRFFANALYGIEKEATKLGYSIITCISNEQLEKERESISVLSNGSVDGFILAVSEETLITKTTNHLQEIINKEIPLIMFDRNLSEVNCSKVIIDDFKAAFEATILLLKKERKQIAFISTINDLNVGVLRRNGYDNAILKNSSLGLKPMYLFISKDADYQTVIQKFLQENPKIDAIVAADNITGTIAVNIAKSLNYKIPKDLSIIGFADELVSNLSVPRLTYINQNAQLIGKNALRIMVKNLKSKGAIKELSTLKIPVEIVHKETTL
jgi:LacI family transcriptional regulator